ncbi:MAG TPA: DCC1-like thiol-disulfide oxidoreductase family protein [Hyphomicrobiaceae bacterium]|nr:DCC1-like thiol-disulfide oxidoreductase family protein [Hyphomicrobiaceae bacterium]
MASDASRLRPEAYPAFSFAVDPAVAPFPTDRPLIVFDGVCVLCSGFAKFVVRRDKRRRFLFTHAQSPLGAALFRHYGLDPLEFETNIVIIDGRAHGRLGAFAAVMGELGWPWRAFTIANFLPTRLADWLYDRIAKNRYRLFGLTGVCMLPDASWRERLIGDHATRD